MNEFELNLRLKQEMESLAPDRLEELLAACAARPQQPNTQPAPAAVAPARRWPRLIAAAAALAIVVSGAFLSLKGAHRSVVTLENGASVTMTVSGFNRVKSVTLNESAQSLLDSSELEGLALDDAARIVGERMVSSAQLHGDANGVLVAVREGDRRADAVSREAAEGLAEAARAASFEPAVLVLRLDEAETPREALAAAVTEQCEGLTSENLDALSMQDLLYAVESQGVALEDGDLVGSVRTWVCANEADAEQLCAAYCGVDGNQTFTTQLGWFAEQLAYQVRFQSGDGWVSHWVSAATGEILDPDASVIVAPQPQQPVVPSAPGEPPAPVPEPQPETPELPANHGSVHDFFDWIDDIF